MGTGRSLRRTLVSDGDFTRHHTPVSSIVHLGRTQPTEHGPESDYCECGHLAWQHPKGSYCWYCTCDQYTPKCPSPTAS
jgi:hypothetical protein